MNLTLNSFAAGAATVLSLAAFASGQEPTNANHVSASSHESQLGGDLVPIHTAEPDNGIEYGLWATGDRYKVSFHGDMTFVPYLGFDYPTNQPISWRTESVTAGGKELLTGNEPTREHTDYRFEYRHGAVTEAYDVRVDGLEQTFVIHNNPGVSGDLVVRGAVATALTTPGFEAAHGSLDFVDRNGDDILRYGEAFVFDSRGRKSPIKTAYHDGKVELTVPAAWLREAAWPVTIDPVFSVTTIGSGAPRSSIDITRDDDADDVMVCYSKGASASDQDTYAVMMNDNFLNRAVVFSDVTASWSTRDTSCATSGSPRRFCVAMSRTLPSSKSIRAHLHNSGDLTFQTGTFLVSGSVAYDSRPDVGGAEPTNTGPFTTSGQNFLIVWQRDIGSATTNASTIYGRRIASLTGVSGAEFPIAVSIIGTRDYEYPSLNQQSRRSGFVLGSKTTWMVVYQNYAAPTWRIEGKLVSDDNVVESGYALGDTGNHRVYPKVAGQYGRYLVSFPLMPFSQVSFKTPSTAGHSLKSQRVDWNSGGSPTAGPENNIIGPFTNRIMLLGGLAYDSNTRSHWSMTTGRYRNVGGNGSTSVLRVGYRGQFLRTETLQLAPSSTHQGVPGGIAFNDDLDEFQPSWTMNDATTGQARVARSSYEPVALPILGGGSCSNATPGWSGSLQVGSQFSSMTLDGAIPNMPALLVMATDIANTSLAPIGMPGCVLLVPASGTYHLGTVATTTTNIGTASFPLPLPEFLGNIIFFYQWFYFEIGSNPLNLVSTYRLRVSLSK